MQISFLASSHDIRAAKRFVDDRVESYPLIKTFNGYSFELPFSIDGLQQKEKILRQQADKGACLVKGALDRDLNKESRKGAIDPQRPTQNIVFDLDGVMLANCNIKLPLTEAKVTQFAERFVALLPSCFQTVSYIVHASSSLGMKGQKISLHMDFWLEKPVAPAALKNYITSLNFSIPAIDSQTSLSASGTALSYRLDPCLADNSRLIYIAPPTFRGSAKDPFEHARERIFLVTKTDIAVDLEPQLKQLVSHARLQKSAKDRLTELRNMAGLPEKRPKTIVVPFNDGHHTAVANPDQVQMRMLEDRGDWVTYNINDGDSGGYYVNKYNPTLVFNFKNEPVFLFEKADPEGYQKHMEHFVFHADAHTRKKNENAPPVPIGFRDYASNVYYNGLFDPSTGSMQSIHKTDRASLADFFAQYDAPLPEPIPTWRYEFKPDEETLISVRDKFINKYCPSPYFDRNILAPDDFRPLSYNNASKLDEWCPHIHQVIMHAVGSSVLEYEHFINWLAHAFQTKHKNGTAWILHGVQGTGKGVLFDHIIRPLVGRGIDKNSPYTIKLRLENIEDQFNAWEETAMFAAIDEFRLGDSHNATKTFNKVKNMISEEETTVRGMRENARDVHTYTNYLIYANDEDMMAIPTDDRRFNVGERQTVKLDQVFPDTHDLIYNRIPGELKMFALIMRTFEVDRVQARKALDNDAKRRVRELSKTSIDEFVAAVRTGDLEYFLPILEMPHTPAGTDYRTPCATILKKILEEWTDESKLTSRLTVEQLRLFYSVLVGRIDSSNKFGRLLNRKGVETKTLRINGVLKRGVEIIWTLRENNIEDLQKSYCNDAAITFVSKNVIPLKSEVTK